MPDLDLKWRLNEWSRWDSLRKLGSSPLVRSSLAFAAAGYLLLWNEKFQEFLILKFDAHAHSPLWRIWMVYYGGICLAVATGLYSLFCPNPIKDHGTAFDLAHSECQYMATMGLGPKYLEQVKRLEANCGPAERAFWPRDRPRDETFKQLRGNLGETEALAALIVYAWRIHNIKHPRLRLVILIIYGVGFGLLTIPAVATFVQLTLFGARELL
jgi:hypothetical protein